MTDFMCGYRIMIDAVIVFKFVIKPYFTKKIVVCIRLLLVHTIKKRCIRKNGIVVVISIVIDCTAIRARNGDKIYRIVIACIHPIIRGIIDIKCVCSSSTVDGIDHVSRSVDEMSAELGSMCILGRQTY